VLREEFAPEAYRELAFGDLAVPLGHGQSMLAPKLEGRILQALYSSSMISFSRLKREDWPRRTFNTSAVTMRASRIRPITTMA